MRLVSLITPLFNEEAGVSALQERLTAVLIGLEYEFEIIVVDDGSMDKTLEIVKNCIKHCYRHDQRS